MRAILIKPMLRSIRELDIKGEHDEIKSLVNADTLTCFRIAEFDDSYDYGWVDDLGLAREEPVDAFKFSNRRDPIAGNCLIVGAEREKGINCDAGMTVDFLNQHVEWLGTIKPEVTTIQDGLTTRLVVTYSRVAS